MDTINIPEELKAINQWVCWKTVPNPKNPAKPRKLPVDAHNPSRAGSSIDPKTWGSFQKALETFERNPNSLKGIGFVMNNDISGLDIDGIEDVNNLPASITEMLEKLNTYTEVSPSGHGLHCFFIGKIPIEWGNNKKTKGDYTAIEAYSKGRYFTVTGDILPKYPIKCAPSDNLIVTLGHVFCQEHKQKTLKTTTKREFDPIKFAAIQSAEPRLVELMKRNVEAMPQGSDTTPSGFDMAICNILAKAQWCEDEMIALLKTTRVRNNEDTKHEGYYERTAQKALNKSSEPESIIDKINHTFSNINIEKIEKHGDGPDSSYYVKYQDGSGIEIENTETFASQKFWRSVILERCRSTLRMKVTEWDLFLSNFLMQLPEKVAGSLDPEKVRMLTWLEDYILSSSVYKESEDETEQVNEALFRKEPIKIGDVTYISTEQLKQFIFNTTGEVVSSRKLSRHLKEMGSEMIVKKVRMNTSKNTDAQVKRRMWSLPQVVTDY